MKETQEFTGKDVSKAVDNACSALGLSKSDLNYEVISTGTSGIFGIVGRKDAKIKVTLPAEEASGDSEMEGILSIVDEAFGEDTRLEGAPAPKPAAKQEPKKKPGRKKKKEPSSADKAAPKEKAGEAEQDDTNGRWDTKPAERPGRKSPEKQKAEIPPPVDVTQESIDLGKEALQKMADLITDEAEIEAVTDQDRLTLQITGGNAGILIGRKGQTLDAMQFLTDKIINRKSEARVRVKVDIEGYMETRKANLKHLAYKMAEKAKKTGRPATINQMSAQDRRIVHLALKDDNQVRTQSMGDGYYRRLVIFPKKRNSYRGKRRNKR
ncbi:MAG: Jag N-terminal domain-containing protein [Desulfobacterales bacterium]|nr:Jag N-terminal domain-containing protein [Desulfobacterales bacterium]